MPKPEFHIIEKLLVARKVCASKQVGLRPWARHNKALGNAGRGWSWGLGAGGEGECLIASAERVAERVAEPLSDRGVLRSWQNGMRVSWPSSWPGNIGPRRINEPSHDSQGDVARSFVGRREKTLARMRVARRKWKEAASQGAGGAAGERERESTHIQVPGREARAKPRRSDARRAFT
jgi:hypothetical protein